MNDSSVRARMEEVLHVLSEDLNSIRTGRAIPALVENIVVSAYGGAQRLKINELSTITTTDSQTIVIEPWDKSIIGEIKQAILAANIGMNPSISASGGSASGRDGSVIIINMPPLTGEDREKYVKLLHAKLENARIMIRQVRGDIMKDLKNAFEKKETTEDERFTQEEKLQGLTDEFVGKIDERGKMKEEELRQI